MLICVGNFSCIVNPKRIIDNSRMISPVPSPRGQVGVQKYHAKGIPLGITAGRVICSSGLRWTRCDVKTKVHLALSL